MADPTPDAPHAPLMAEFLAIKTRVEAATKDAERALLKTQFGERLVHLAERLKAIEEAAEGTPQTSAPPAA